MDFFSGNLYHLYNRGNNCQPIFYSMRNYLFFMEKIKKYIMPHCDILAWCLMPTRFHLMIHTDERAEATLTHLPITKNHISEGVRLMLSAYCKAINRQEDRTGNLFQQKTRAKCLSNLRHPELCFHYLHMAPVKDGLVQSPGEWAFSSYTEYTGSCPDTEVICNRTLAMQLLPVNNPAIPAIWWPGTDDRPGEEIY
jgi:putative transposase